MKELFFFRHYMTELQNPAIAALYKKFGAKGYGMYWHLLERLYADEAHMLPNGVILEQSLASSLKLSRFTVRRILNTMRDLGLISKQGPFITCERVENEIRQVEKCRNRNRSPQAS
ncbi:Lin1244/Lin1753 domain-containing protein [uncultured Sphaerochaeta sp.]|uniref:Lin1244/Lin1753 domain-containing protein n=1 Tax=uncultured Sphaerochaeta sp. TaxID=886478 RepID=UPI0029C9BEF0|nr:Lin1244/Lin1753 domain-containing protein [uncultured Sphaerochaeta sp.]